MPIFYIKYSGITAGTADLVLSELQIGDGTTPLVPTGITSNIAPSVGTLANLTDANLTTEATWTAVSSTLTITIAYNETPLPILSHIRQGSGVTWQGQISEAAVEQSPDQVTWTSLHDGPTNSATTANTYAAWTPLVTPIVEYVTDSASATVATENHLAANTSISDSATSAEANTFFYEYVNLQADTAAVTDTFTHSAFTFYMDAVGLSDSLVAEANTTSALSDTAAIADIIQQAINQIVSDSASGAETFSLGAALALIDVADAVATHTSTYNSVMLVAELIATIEAYNSVAGEDIVESGALTDAYTALVKALVNTLESAQAVDTNTALVHVMQAAADSATATTEITSTGSLLNALLADGVVATVRINIGGELFTGWVLNADTLAPSEYQFADLSFNSACKHGDRYLMAADDGIYQFTDEVGVETVMTYIKTGRMDFGSDKHKRVINSYMVYSSTKQMRLKVTTSENGQIRTHTYQMTPFASNETTDTRRFDIGKGLKSRYWQFEIVGEGGDDEFDEIGMLPVILSRRI